MDAAEGLLVGDVIHEDEAHGSTVVGCCDSPVALLSSRVLQDCVMQFILEVFFFTFELRKGQSMSLLIMPNCRVMLRLLAHHLHTLNLTEKKTFGKANTVRILPIFVA